MILTIYLVLLALAMFSIALGLTTKEPYFSFVGLFFMFNLSLVLLSGTLEVPTGNDITNTYFYTNGTLDNTSTILTDTYTSFDKTSAKWYGFLLAFVSGIGAFALFWDLKNSYENNKGEGQYER